MKKLLLFSAMLYAFICSAQTDTTDPVRKALYEVAQHPKELTDSQATHLYLNAGVRDTVRIDYIVRAPHFSPIPLMTNWVEKSKNTAFWYDNGWKQENNIFLYREDFLFSLVVRMMLLAILLIFITNPAVDCLFFKKRVKREAKDDMYHVQDTIKSFHYNQIRKRAILFRKEILWPILALCFIVFSTKFQYGVLLYSTVAWWLAIASFITYHVRNFLTKRTYNKIRVRYPSIKETEVL